MNSPTFLYLVQTPGKIPEIYDYLKSKKIVLLSFKENTEETDIFFPGSTWTTGRNKLREHVISKNMVFDYYIFLDDDVQFEEMSQEEGFNKFEEMVNIYKPEICVPKLQLFYDNLFDNNINSTVTTIFYDAIYSCFSHKMLLNNIIFPYDDTFDKNSWWISQYILFMLCSLLNIDILLFRNINISNTQHNEYPRSMEKSNEAQEHVFKKLSDLNIQFDKKWY